MEGKQAIIIGLVIMLLILFFMTVRDRIGEREKQEEQIRKLCGEKGYELEDWEIAMNNTIYEATCIEIKGNEVKYHKVIKYKDNFYLEEE